MGEFFKAWRRKIGLLTLVVACVFTAGWVRSYVILYTFEIVARKTKYSGSSMKGRIALYHDHADQARVIQTAVRRNSAVIATTTISEFEFTGNQLDIVVGEFYFKSGTDITGYYSDLLQTPGPPIPSYLIAAQAPYWSITIPLTLISLWLLLSKARRTNQKKITEPIKAEGT